MARHPRWDAHRVSSQSERTVVVTGGTSGLGLEVARVMGARGAHVVIGVRSTERGEAAVRDLPGRFDVRRLDLASLDSVREFAAGLGEVDVLVNNAGVMAPPYARTVEGFELQFGTNHVGHAALTALVLPTLRDRVVVVSSNSHKNGRLELDDLDWTRRRYQPYAAYAASKLANLLFMSELQRRLTATGSTLRAVGAHPGYTATNITTHTGKPAFDRISALGNRLFGMPVSRGALPVLFAASQDVPGNTYLGPHRLAEMNGWPTMVGRSPAAADPALARALWERTSERAGIDWGDLSRR